MRKSTPCQLTLDLFSGLVCPACCHWQSHDDYRYSPWISTSISSVCRYCEADLYTSSYRLHTHPGQVHSCNTGAFLRDQHGHITTDEWQSICEEHHYLCAHCKQGKSLVMDHIMPIKAGGWHGTSNIQPLCTDCNIKKSARFEGQDRLLIMDRQMGFSIPPRFVWMKMKNGVTWHSFESRTNDGLKWWRPLCTPRNRYLKEECISTTDTPLIARCAKCVKSLDKRLKQRR